MFLEHDFLKCCACGAHATTFCITIAFKLADMRNIVARLRFLSKSVVPGDPPPFRLQSKFFRNVQSAKSGYRVKIQDFQNRVQNCHSTGPLPALRPALHRPSTGPPSPDRRPALQDAEVEPRRERAARAILWALSA